MSGINIYIIDNYFIIREGLKQSLLQYENLYVVGENENLENSYEQIKELKPDVLIVEINLCRKPVRTLVEEIKTISPKTNLLIVSDCDCQIPILSAVRAGISGFIRKNLSKEELFKAVTIIATGKSYYSQDITQLLTNTISTDVNFAFSERELEVLYYICKGRSNEQIGDILFISEKTIATHRRNIMRKAGIKKSSELIVWAINNKLVDHGRIIGLP